MYGWDRALKYTVSYVMAVKLFVIFIVWMFRRFMICLVVFVLLNVVLMVLLNIYYTFLRPLVHSDWGWDN